MHMFANFLLHIVFYAIILFALLDVPAMMENRKLQAKLWITLHPKPSFLEMLGDNREERETGDTRKKRMQELNNTIKGIEKRQKNLLEAIEKGVIELDDITKKRVQELKSSREALFIEQANARLNSESIREEAFSVRRVEAFGEMLRAKLSDTSKPLAKSYLRLLVKDVIVSERTATIRGGYKTLIASFQSGSDSVKGEVPSFNPVWCA